MQVVIGGRVVHYEMSGSDPLLLFVHGWGSSGEVFTGIAQQMKRYQTLLVDPPGFGTSQAPNAAWGLSEFAEFLAEFLGKIGAKSPYALISHSNGAAIAVRGLADGVLSTEKLVIYGGAGIREVKSGKKRALKTLSRAGKPILLVLPKRTQVKIKRKWYGSIGSELMLISGMEETFKKIVAEDVLELAARIDVPTLLIYGEQDQATPPEYGELYYQTFPHAQLCIIGGAGHFVFVDNAEEVIRQTKEFL